MTRAEQEAKEIRYLALIEANRIAIEQWDKGYEQAEKDLALTWEDMALAFKCVNAALDDCDGKTREEVLKDALRRFNEQRQK